MPDSHGAYSSARDPRPVEGRFVKNDRVVGSGGLNNFALRALAETGVRLLKIPKSV
jgi:hypothetical protein